MDFMNFMNQINGSSCGHSGGGCCHDNNGFNHGCNCGFNNCNNNGCGSGILPLLLLSGLSGFGQGNNNFSGGRMTCYPNNQGQQYFMPQSSFYDSGIKYKTRKIKQAYVEMPVSTYYVSQPMYSMNQQPTTMNIIPTCENNNNCNRGNDLCLLLFLLALCNRNNGVPFNNSCNSNHWNHCHPCCNCNQARNFNNEHHSEL